MIKKVVFTGGNGRFAGAIKKIKSPYKIFYPNKKELNILSEKTIENYLRKIRPKILVHMAGLSRPMKQHEEKIHRSIELNIVGTANIVKVCSRMNIKVIYFIVIVMFFIVDINLDGSYHAYLDYVTLSLYVYTYVYMYLCMYTFNL